MDGCLHPICINQARHYCNWINLSELNRWLSLQTTRTTTGMTARPWTTWTGRPGNQMAPMSDVWRCILPLASGMTYRVNRYVAMCASTIKVLYRMTFWYLQITTTPIVYVEVKLLVVLDFCFSYEGSLLKPNHIDVCQWHLSNVCIPFDCMQQQ